ncbi:metallophosphoesterase family protein [Rhodopseudomonas sp. NSM]|uniref:metallophosphoesterase family protein n=1 Tax=Rhodopseudomonas sp. NSM TaxID=3457630 RepID=UPI00403731F0
MPAHQTTQISGAASTPPATRIYAVGDIHGRADLLAEIADLIDDDQRRRPVRHAIEVYLGDYIDRGPDSRAAIDILCRRLVRKRAICLRGNHEELMENFLRDPRALQRWLQLGGLNTLASYQLSPASKPEKIDADALREQFMRVFPRAHQLFLACLRTSFHCGDYLFVHAGIRPGVPVALQDPADLMWIRNDFLDWPHMHEAVIVHGHTPVPHPDIRPNRINIDTGAWKSGVLTCLVLEGSSVQML